MMLLHRGCKVNEFVEVNHTALNNIHKVLEHYLPGGKWQGSEYLALNPRRPDKHVGSFSINGSTGEWADFATEDAGGDIISLIAYVENVTQTAAKQSLSQLLGISNSSVTESKNVTHRSEARNSLSSADTKPLQINQTNSVTTVTQPTWTALTPVPKHAPPSPTKHPSLGLISIKHIYRASDGQIICYICRFEIMSDDGLEKTFRPLTYCRSNTGQESWQWIGMPEPRILYNQAP
jgi:putative DNA primase/helicase